MGSTPVAATHTQERTGQGGLSIVLIAGLIGNVLVNVALQVLIVRGLIPPLAIINALTLVIAGACATRWRWAPLLAAVWCALAIVPGAEPYTYNLTHPADAGKFIATVFGLGLYLIVIVAGVAVTVAAGRPSAGRAPGWLGVFLSGVLAFALGTSLVAAAPRTSASAGVSAEALAQLPALVTAQNRFEPTELRARVGETVALRLDNRDAVQHSFDIDELNVHVAMPAGASALALFRPNAPGRYIFYCQIPGHREAGMIGALIVEP